MNRGSSEAYSWLLRGSTCIALAYASCGHPDNMGTAATVLLLDAGEHVYAKHGRGTLQSDSLTHDTYFAGFLIHKSD